MIWIFKIITAALWFAALAIATVVLIAFKPVFWIVNVLFSETR